MKRTSRLFPRGYLPLYAMVIGVFFLWGMSNNLTDILVQQFRKSLTLSQVQAQLVQTAVFFGYFFMALPAALGMRRWGYKAGLLGGLCLFGTGMLLLWPAALIGRYGFMLGAMFVTGCGSAILETAANPFIAESGPAETAERRLNLAQAFNPPGTIVGVLVGTVFIFSGVELTPAQVAVMQQQNTYAAYLHTELMRIVPTYVTLGCVVLLLALALSVTAFPPVTAHEGAAEDSTGSVGPQLILLLRRPQVLAAMTAQFFYCGAQVSTWSAYIPYVKQYTGATERTAALLLTGNLVALAIGRVLSTALMRWFRPVRMLTLYALVNVALALCGVLRPGPFGTGALLLSSFFMSIMFPTIFARGVSGLGTATKLAGSLLVMSILGAAVVPPLLGLLARATGQYSTGFVIVVACYCIVALYGLFSGPGEPGSRKPS